MERIVITFFTVVFFVFGATCSSSAQTKKEQITSLQLRIDSLSAVLEQTRLQLDDSQNQLKDKISSSSETETRLNAELSTKSKTLQELSEKNAKLNFQLTILNDSLIKVNNRAKDYVLQLTSLMAESDMLKADLEKNAEKNSFELLDFDLEYSSKSFISDLVTFDGDENSSESELNGLFTSYYSKDDSEIYSISDRQVYATGNFKKGFKEGQWYYYNCDGSVAILGEFKNGLREGKWKCFNHCFTKIGFLDLRVLLDYYNLSVDYPKYVQSLNFKKGLPSDTILVENIKGKVVFKIIKKESSLVFLYANNQPLSDQSLVIDEDGFLIGFEDSSKLKLFQEDGSLKYLLVGNENNCEELKYSQNGKLSSKCVVKNGQGIIYFYDLNGKLEDSIEGPPHMDKWGADCICQ